MATSSDKLIAFQGAHGAYSELACREAFPDVETLPCATFADAFAAVRSGQAALAMIPIENTVAGRVADIHHLMPRSGLHIVGEHFLRIRHHLLGAPGASLETIETVRSHIHALSQCREVVKELGLRPVIHSDTATAAEFVKQRNDPTIAAIASSLSAEIYGLDVLRANVEDAAHNTTRFVVMAREARDPGPDSGPVVTTFVFKVRNVPAALYKAMGGFATNGVNMTKLESYLEGGGFTPAQFYCDIEGHPAEQRVSFALEELNFFSREVDILGVYPASPLRFG